MPWRSVKVGALPPGIRVILYFLFPPVDLQILLRQMRPNLPWPRVIPKHKIPKPWGTQWLDFSAKGKASSPSAQLTQGSHVLLSQTCP